MGLKQYQKIIISMSLIVVSVFADNLPNQTIVDEVQGYKYIDISKTDINRAYCENGEFTQLIFSSEKEIDIQKNGKNAFIKLIPINKTQGDEILSTTINTFAREAYLTCDNKMFSLILVPKEIPAQTIILKTVSDEKRVEKNKEIEVVNDYQTTVSELIKSVYKEITPEGFDLEFIDKPKVQFDELSLIEFKKYVGSTLIVDELIIKANQDVSLNEKMFLPYLQNPLAISLENHKLTKDSTTRLFVVANANPMSNYVQNSSKYSNAIELIQQQKQKEVKDNSRKYLSDEVIDFAKEQLSKEQIENVLNNFNSEE